MKYRKKPVIVDALLFDGEKWLYERKEAYHMVVCEGCKRGEGIFGLDFIPVIETLEGNMTVSHGDYIITGVNGEYYPCKPDVFRKTYELVNE